MHVEYTSVTEVLDISLDFVLLFLLFSIMLISPTFFIGEHLLEVPFF